MNIGLYYANADSAITSKTDEENEPLLASRTEAATIDGSTQPDYASISTSDIEDSDIGSDEDEPKTVKELRKQQRKRLKQHGSWLAYFKDYKILVVLVWPSDDRYVQGCLAVLVSMLAVDRALNVLLPRQLGIVTNQLASMADTGEVPYKALGLWMLFSWLRSRAGFGALQQFADLPISQYAYRSIGTAAFSHLMNLSMDFHNNKNSGELIAAVGQGQHLYRLVDFMVLSVGPMILDLVIAFVYITVLFDATMACILVFVGVLYTYLGTAITAYTVKRRRRLNDAWRNESKVQNEAINNWQTVAHFNRAEYECTRYSKTVDDHNRAEREYLYIHYLAGAAQSLLLLTGRLSAAVLAAYRVSQGSAPVGSFITLVTYWSAIEGPLTSVSYSVRQLSQMLIDSERLLELLRTQPSVSDIPGADELKIKHGKVEFANVDFAYDPRKSALKDISFVARPGTTIALVGETGGGKSTILKLLYRSYDVTGGSIKIDDRDIRHVTLNSLRNSFGLVPQDPALFNISILENVRYARLDATDAEVHAACAAAAIHDKIISFPDGYASTVGERGVKLSGGELQRISIARAILRNPAIVLLDEATSMIDAETESLIQEAFQKLTKDRTTFVVAHRLSTIQHADLILVVQNGEIVERGTHEELFKLDGKYVKLWSRQLSKQVEVAKTVLSNLDDAALKEAEGRNSAKKDADEDAEENAKEDAKEDVKEDAKEIAKEGEEEDGE
ncbi:hypothetical protein MBLNU459_g7226t2 [Dothideomycetes sp. NU459]